GHLRPVSREGLACARARSRTQARRARAHDDGLFTGDDRAGLLDGSHGRPPFRRRGVRLGGPEGAVIDALTLQNTFPAHYESLPDGDAILVLDVTAQPTG